MVARDHVIKKSKNIIVNIHPKPESSDEDQVRNAGTLY